MSSSTIDQRDLRNAFGTFATGVTVVTTMDAEGQPRGFTANSFSSVSLDPPLVLVCLARSASSYPAFMSTDQFAINILAEDQKDVSGAFASRTGAKFDSVSWTGHTTGSPIIDGATSWLDCTMHQRIDAGDHVILVGAVVDYAYSGRSPLGYCRGAYVTFGLASQAIAAAELPGTAQIGAIIEAEGAILLFEDPATHALELPVADRLGPKSEADSLLGVLAAQGVDAQLSFLFAVFEDPDTGKHNIFYRGQASEVRDPARQQFIAFEDIPFDRIPDRANRAMLQRYIRERRQDVFGVYVGNVDRGSVNLLSTSEPQQVMQP
ncbi:flavin reductase (DIM6/NTAB) family NADH-FMN oxidoreductase RutF [Rhodoligotrophos appendicifer]|uniref:flavin reductase n=1 Tax=Rhodoligotrophos appendicifer TaxID=987056 RepID=UPI001961F87B|nr:flavin reductase family protein [Rhodoligotrophos appendicifer]